MTLSGRGSVRRVCAELEGNFRCGYGIAVRMAQDALIPAIEAQPTARVLVNDFSCRQRINESANRDSTHLAVLLDEVLPK
jgi:hypothetical protein